MKQNTKTLNDSQTQRFLRDVKIAIEKALGTKLKVRELSEKGETEKMRIMIPLVAIIMIAAAWAAALGLAVASEIWCR